MPSGYGPPVARLRTVQSAPFFVLRCAMKTRLTTPSCPAGGQPAGEMSRRLRVKIKNKRANAAKEGIPFCLSRSDVVALLTLAGISCDDWNPKGHHLARYGDKGGYSLDNCRFIPCSQNYKERVISQKSIAASRRNMTAYISRRTPVEIMVNQNKLRAAIANRRSKGLPVGGQGRLTESQLEERFNLVAHIDFKKYGVLAEAGILLGCSPQHVGRLIKRWIALGLLG